MEIIRAFIAVDIGEDIRGKLDELQRTLKKVHANVRWTRPHGIHLTLAFLGDLAADKLDPLRQALDSALSGHQPFELQAVGTGFFGRSGRPRVIWAGVAASPPLIALQRKTVEALQDAGIEFDSKPFSPHLTLGRVKAPDHIQSLLDWLEKFKNTPLGQTRVKGINLYQSLLKPGGAEYNVLHSVSFPDRNRPA